MCYGKFKLSPEGWFKHQVCAMHWWSSMKTKQSCEKQDPWNCILWKWGRTLLWVFKDMHLCHICQNGFVVVLWGFFSFLILRFNFRTGSSCKGEKHTEKTSCRAVKMCKLHPAGWTGQVLLCYGHCSFPDPSAMEQLLLCSGKTTKANW